MATCDNALHVRDRLTLRECEAMDWLVLGYASWEIAEKMGDKEHTIEYFLGQSFDKLGASNRVQAAVLYLRYYCLDQLPTFWQRWQRERKERDLFRAPQKATNSRRTV